MFRRLVNGQLWLGLRALKSWAGRTLTSFGRKCLGLAHG